MYHLDYTEASSSVASVHSRLCTTIINAHFPSSVSKESACSAGDPGSIPGWGRSPGERNFNSLQYSHLENPMDRGLAGYSPWGREELDTTERLTLHHATSSICVLNTHFLFVK